MPTPRTTVRLLAAALALAGGLLAGRANAAEEGEASRVRILLVIDTEGADAEANGFAHDKDRMKKVIKETMREQNLEDRYTLDVLHGAGATPERVVAYYRTLKVAPTEALLCYYSGHGGTELGRGHFLEMKGGRLFRSELRAAMESRRPRLLVLLSDCCASYVSGPLGGPTGRVNVADREKDGGKDGRKRQDVAARQNTSKSFRGETFRHLLFQHRGLVDVGACKVGKMAFSSGKGGGYFTLTLTGLLAADGDRFEADEDGIIGWDGFFTALQAATGRHAVRDETLQTPHAFAMSVRGGR
jgi:hypothetical protein